MDKETLVTKKSELEKRFEEVIKQKDNCQVELLRLQGEYRAISTLIEELEKPTPEPEEGEQ